MTPAADRTRADDPVALSLLRDDGGGVVSIDFMLTIPIFLTVFMLTLQLGLVLAAEFVVEHAALTAARAAAVWIPADLPAEPRNRMLAAGRKMDHVLGAAEEVCVAVSPRALELGGGGGTLDLEAERLARLAAQRLGGLTRIDVGGRTAWAATADVTVAVEHDFVLRVPIARSILGSRLLAVAGPYVVTLRASATLPNQGAFHGPNLE